MAIVIPSKNIYEKEVDSVVDIEIDNVVAKADVYTVESKSFLKINESLFQEDITGLFDNVFKYSPKDSYESNYFTNYVGIQSAIASATIKIESEDFIIIDDQNNITLNLLLSGGWGTDTDLSDGVFSIKNITQIQRSITIEVPIDGSIAQSKTFWGENDGVVSCYFTKPQNNLEMSKSFELYISIQSWSVRSGTKEATVVSNVELDISGNVLKKSEIGLSTEQSSEQSSKKGFYEIASNELLQEKTTIYGNPVFDYLSDQIIKRYKNGKELVELLCSIDDYYDESGKKVISMDGETDKMHFDIGDEILPRVFGADGKEYPLSRYMDGSPKKFRVVSRKFIYDGAVWQKIIGQEVAKNI